jgi:predicted PurR-regulated permease PerM
MALTDRIKVRTKAKKAPADYGVLGNPIDRAHPFYFGFVATLGVLIAIVLMRALASASQIFVLIIVALFLATGLNPAVEAIQRRKVTRTNAVTIIFTAVILFVIFFVTVVIPPVISQGTQLINNAPGLLSDLKQNATFADLNNRFGIIDSLQVKLTEVTSDGTIIISAFGGVVGVGKSVLSGAFTALTVLILTLYFITSLPQMTEMGLRFVPLSRRDRVSRLTNAVISRVGSFVASQVLIAFMAAVFTLLLSFSLSLPSPFALAMIVLVCGLIPLIGHFIGCAVVTVVALTQSVTVGLIAFLTYVIYVQIENYLVTPRIMKRTLAVPGVVTIISALIGASLFGLIGGLLAVPVAASVILILDEVVFPHAESS